MKMSQVFKASLLLTIFFGVNKILGLVRQAFIAREFGISAQIDAFNVSNNIPDLLFSLISGGALALAFIPVMTEYFDKKGNESAWKLFSGVTNIVFLSTALLSIVVAIFAPIIVSSNFGVAPGFSPDNQILTVNLMRLNLLATLIFSLSGLVMASLQAKKHFLLPAIAPLLYNVGQIIGATIFATYFNLGIYGLMYGVILGSFLHLLIQLPGLVHFKFRYSLSFNSKDSGVSKVLILMGPRILTVLIIQIMFITRDNLASRLPSGAVSALTYGYFIMQVPETLIGTAIATALLPSLSQFAERKEIAQFTEMLNKSIKIITAVTLITTTLSFFVLDFFLQLIFNFSPKDTLLLSTVTKVFMLGLLFQCLLEITTRAFYAKQDSKTPFIITLGRGALFILIAVFSLQFGASGLAMADTISTSIAVIVMGIILVRSLPQLFSMKMTLIRTLIVCLISTVVFYTLSSALGNSLVTIMSTLIVTSTFALVFLRSELKLLLKL